MKAEPRTKPTSVRPPSRARSIARLDGADTDATIGMPARYAFCTISNDARPLTHNTRSSDRKLFGEQHPADDFVDGVVAADVFGDALQAAVRGEQAGRVQTTGQIEQPLRRAQAIRQSREQCRIDEEGAAQRRPVDRQRFDGQPPAQAARRVGRHLAARRQQLVQAFDGWPGQGDVENVQSVPAIRHRADVVRAGHDVFRQQKPRGELTVLARRAHHHRERPSVEANLERLFDRRAVGVRGPDRALHTDDVDRPDRLGHVAMLR